MIEHTYQLFKNIINMINNVQTNDNGEIKTALHNYFNNLYFDKPTTVF